MPLTDREAMSLALSLAQKAAEAMEVPVGAVLLGPDRKIIATGQNARESTQSPFGHAEAIAIQQAAKVLNSWRLEGCTMFVTLEPCLMCAGAILQSRISKLVYGAADPKAGAVESLYQTLSDKRLNHQCSIESGLFAEDSSLLLKNFFAKLRSQKP